MAIALLALLSAGILVLPRRWAAVVLMACACYVPVVESIQVGPFSFYGLRLILLLGLVRASVRGEKMQGGAGAVCIWMSLWAAAALLTSLLHEDPLGTLINRLGLVFTAGATYCLFRSFCAIDEIEWLCKALAWLLTAVAIGMSIEKLTGFNVISVIGGPAFSEVRNGTVRAQGAFAHSILAGSVGAACLPLMLVIRRNAPRTSWLGMTACSVMVLTCGSSGPLMGAATAIVALCLWPMRRRMKLIRWALVLSYVGLAIVMTAPAYYVLSYIDLTGSSTSWHRAFLIETALAHIEEWWLFGTDYTRHWMAYGVLWNEKHIDITNYYIRMGVDGGLPLLLSFVALLLKAFDSAGTARQRLEAAPQPRLHALAPWAFGAALMSHAASFISVSYFDQSVLFFYFVLAAIGTMAVSVHETRLPVVSGPALRPTLPATRSR